MWEALRYALVCIFFLYSWVWWMSYKKQVESFVIIHAAHLSASFTSALQRFESSLPVHDSVSVLQHTYHNESEITAGVYRILHHFSVTLFCLCEYVHDISIVIHDGAFSGASAQSTRWPSVLPTVFPLSWVRIDEIWCDVFNLSAQRHSNKVNWTKISLYYQCGRTRWYRGSNNVKHSTVF